uniref:Bm13212 n=1 Tax=Brugia malayi TaxID=6279 RepID=A0A1I9G3H4_BRUMA|nr:Bm13212 [Brugia malayi]
MPDYQVEQRIVSGCIRIVHITTNENVNITVCIFQGVVVGAILTTLQQNKCQLLIFDMNQFPDIIYYRSTGHHDWKEVIPV